MLLFKHYFPGDKNHQPRLEYAGRAIVPLSCEFIELYPLVKKKAGLAGDAESIELYEEVKYNPTVYVDLVKPNMTLGSAKLESGDILIVQQAGVPGQSPFLTADAFMKHVRNRVSVTFKRIEGSMVVEDEESTVHLDLLKNMTYDDVSAALSGAIRQDHPLKVRLTLQSLYTTLPRPQPHTYAPSLFLEDLIRSHGQIPQSPVLYYEPIDLPLPEYERLMSYRVAFHNSKHEETTAVTVRVLKDRTIADMLEEVRAQLPVEVHKNQQLRLMEVWHWRIWHVFDPSQPVEKNLSTSGASTPWHLRIEVVPEDQRELDQEGQLHVHCLQVEDKEGSPKNAFPCSDPFIMSVGPTETIGELKKRVQKEMEVPDKEFEDWKVVLVSGMNNTQEPLADDVVIAQRLNPDDLSFRKLWGHSDRQMLGFHHENKNPRKTHAHINRPSAVAAQERALKIRA